MSEPIRKNMRFRFYYVYDSGHETSVDLEFRLNKEAEDWTKTEFEGLTYVRHERLVEEH